MGRAGAVDAAAGALIITSNVLPAAINTSVCTRGADRFGRGFPSSAIRVNPGTVAAAPAPLNPCVNEPTIEGTCMRKPALTRRTKTVPVTGVVAELGTAGNIEFPGMFLLNARPLMR